MHHLQFFFCSLIFLTWSLVGPSQAAERPNFVVIIGDDISWDDYGAYGHPHIRTPHFLPLVRVVRVVVVS